MIEYESEMQKIVYEEYGDEIEKVKEHYKKKLEQSKKELEQIKKQLKQSKKELEQIKKQWEQYEIEKQYKTGINEILKKEKLSNNAKAILENLLQL